jgi:hypothetical protein
MKRQFETGEGPPSLVFFCSAEEEARILRLLRDYLSRHSRPRIRQLLSMELLNLAGNDMDPVSRHHSQPSQ